MYNDRQALLNFNYLVTDYVRAVDKDSIEENEDVKRLFSKKGTLKRAEIPAWVKNAVYFRDRGRCCFCGCDLSGLLSPKSKKHYDHIVPLKTGGLNDVSNIQLLCSTCNQTKGGNQIATSNFYESWY